MTGNMDLAFPTCDLQGTLGFFSFFFKNMYLFTWLCQVLVVAHRIFDLHCGTQHLLGTAYGI